MAKELTFCFIRPQNFPPEGFFFVIVISSKLQSGFNVLFFTCVPAASNSLQTCFLLIFHCFLTLQTSYLPADDDSLCFLPDHGSDRTAPCTLYLELFAQRILGCFAPLIFAELLRLSDCSACGRV